MSSDPAVAYQEGQAEADAASLVASQIGLTGSGMGGSIIYYDVEAYGTSNLHCREAVRSFIAGWTERLHYWGNQAGAYGSACNSNVSDWAGALHPPDDLWVAAISYSRYHKNVPLFGISCLPDNLWPNHQRIRQYTVGHNETWGNVTFNIDSNVADAEVVTQTQGVKEILPPIIFSSRTSEIADYYSLVDTQGKSWLITDQGMYRSTHNGQNWQLNPSLPTRMAIRKLFFLDERLGWLIASPNGEKYALFSTSDGGKSWLKSTSLPIDPGWSPESLQFSGAKYGWIALKKLTGGNFDIGGLLYTTDNGMSWQKLDMPIGDAVRFTTTEIGWVAGGVGGNELYQTLDGGRTWKLVSLPLPKGSRIAVSLPVFTDPLDGVLPVIFLDPEETQLVIYSTRDGGITWLWSYSASYIPDGLTSVYFSTPLVGWGVANVGSCQTTDHVKACILQSKIWRTEDGGNTWKWIQTPD
jgi:hypothetical protein